jgi:hypothetical protein
MVSPVVIGSFAAIDVAVIGQIAYALRDYERRGRGRNDAAAHRHSAPSDRHAA